MATLCEKCKACFKCSGNPEKQRQIEDIEVEVVEMVEKVAEEAVEVLVVPAIAKCAGPEVAAVAHRLIDKGIESIADVAEESIKQQSQQQ